MSLVIPEFFENFHISTKGFTKTLSQIYVNTAFADVIQIYESFFFNPNSILNNLLSYSATINLLNQREK